LPIKGWQGVFVLSNPEYYSRFGFDAILASGFKSPYSGSHLMALVLCASLPVTAGMVEICVPLPRVALKGTWHFPGEEFGHHTAPAPFALPSDR